MMDYYFAEITRPTSTGRLADCCSWSMVKANRAAQIGGSFCTLEARSMFWRLVPKRFIPIARRYPTWVPFSCIEFFIFYAINLGTFPRHCWLNSARFVVIFFGFMRPFFSEWCQCRRISCDPPTVLKYKILQLSLCLEYPVHFYTYIEA